MKVTNETVMVSLEFDNASATLCGRDDVIECLRRIVSYYDSKHADMSMQARAQHEDTMFGAARAILTNHKRSSDYEDHRQNGI